QRLHRTRHLDIRRDGADHRALGARNPGRQPRKLGVVGVDEVYGGFFGRCSGTIDSDVITDQVLFDVAFGSFVRVNEPSRPFVTECAPTFSPSSSSSPRSGTSAATRSSTREVVVRSTARLRPTH